MSKRREIAYLTQTRDEYAKNWQRARNEADALRKKVLDLEYEIGSLENRLSRANADHADAYRRRQVAEQDAARHSDLLLNLEQALEVLAPALHKRYTARTGVMDWNDLIADAKRVEEHNATTEVLRFIEVSQEGVPF